MADDSGSASDSGAASSAPWRLVVAKYRRPCVARAAWQLANTAVPYGLCWYLMYHTLQFSWWLTIPLAILAGALLVRIFIIFHDCGHGSFFRSRRANDIVGFITGLLTFSPYHHWRWQHAIHHGTAGDLDRRGMGDIWTMTVREYEQSSRWKQLAYRLARNPFVLFVLAPFFVFVIQQRFACRTAGPRERRSVWWMNLALLGTAALLGWIFEIAPYLLIQGTVLMVAGAAGVWMFYVQHQFEDAYWERSENWDYVAAALRGSSYYKLPKTLQWFSGNIGFHHIHQLSPHIPNYRLQQCHEAEPLFQQVRPITLTASLKSVALRLWDEKSRKLIGYARLRQLRKERKQ
jgi:omega-6 fatty acid desaturase (delta-12 desaturase)